MPSLLASDNGIRDPHVDRRARRAQAGVRQALWLRDGGKLVAPFRRGERRAPDERGARADARLSAARLHPVVRVRGGRSRRPTSHGAGARRAARAAARRLTLSDMDLVEMHEAFAAQVLCNLAGFLSYEWAERAGFADPVGEVDRAKLNVLGGSVAVGHPFGATGGRILTTLVNELTRRGGQFGLMTVCAAGGLGHAMVVERA